MKHTDPGLCKFMQLKLKIQNINEYEFLHQYKLMLSVLSIRCEDDISVISFLRRTYWGLTWQMMLETFVIT